MLQLLSPLALFALGALAIPAVLHLWRPPPRTIRVGTLRFFTAPAVRRLTKLRWRERLLLFVRLLLLTMLALLLAQPIWRKLPPTEPQRWALIEPGVVLEGEPLKRFDELTGRGFEPRELAPGLHRTKGSAREQHPAHVPDVWSLLREVDARLPAGSSVAVFASDRLTSLRGERPVMQHCTVDWISVPTALTSDARWLRAAEVINEAEVRVAIRRSDVNGTDEMAVTVPRRPGRTALEGPMHGWRVELANTKDAELSARLVRDGADSTSEPSVPVVRSKPLRAAIIHSADRADDARYVGAAVRAIAAVSRRDVAVGDEAERADWLFWLNDEPPPRDLVEQATRRGATVVSDAENSRERATPLVSSIDAETAGEPIALFRRVAPSAPALAVWTDGFGTPLLSLTQEGDGRHLRFFSRFHPEWNDLPRSSALAAALQPLLLPASDDLVPDRRHDKRRADGSQGRPAERKEPSGEAVRLPPQAEAIDLHTTIWLLCLALFAVERTLSHYHRAPARPEPVRTPRREEPAFAEQT